MVDLWVGFWLKNLEHTEPAPFFSQTKTLAGTARERDFAGTGKFSKILENFQFFEISKVRSRVPVSEREIGVPAKVAVKYQDNS